jgi:hypothetical protein
MPTTPPHSHFPPGQTQDSKQELNERPLSTIYSVSPNDIDLVVHVGGYDFALASLRRAEQDRNALPVQPIRWHHFTVAPEATISEESIDD